MSEMKDLQKVRKTRRDAGIPKLSERDLWLLGWIGEQWGVQRDQLEKLLARRIARQDLVTRQGFLSSKGVIERWEAQGLAVYRKLVVERPGWIWLTKKGLSELGFSFSYVELKPTSDLNHMYWTNQVRMYVEAKHADRVWISERALKYGRQGRKNWLRHPTDGDILAGEDLSKRIAVEVELTAKSYDRTLEIMTALTRHNYDAVWYFVTAKSRGVVERCYKQQSPDDQSKFRIFDVNELA